MTAFRVGSIRLHKNPKRIPITILERLTKMAKSGPTQIIIRPSNNSLCILTISSKLGKVLGMAT